MGQCIHSQIIHLHYMFKFYILRKIIFKIFVIYMYKCHMYVYVHTHEYIYVYLCICICIYKYQHVYTCIYVLSSVQSLSRVWHFVTPWTAAPQASLSLTNSLSILNPCPLSWWCHSTISSSVVPFSFCPQSFPASGSFQMSQLFTSDDQSIGVSASTSVLLKNAQD